MMLLSACGCGSSGPIPNSNFVVWDGTAYIGKPDLSNLGMVPITSISEYEMWGGDGIDESNPPDPQTISPILQQLNDSNGTAFIDIESWPVYGSDPAVIAESIRKYLGTIKSFQQVAPSAKLGYYGVAPIRDYWNVLSGPGSTSYKAWQKRNDVVAPIAAQADVLFPSIYTFYPDKAGWKKYAIAQIKEARRIAPGKPVFAFLWPRYELNGGPSNYMPADYWRMELETIRQYADGVVIWGGWGPDGWEQWDENAPWWQQTQAFLTELQRQRKTGM
jgi:hypothetical protein